MFNFIYIRKKERKKEGMRNFMNLGRRRKKDQQLFFKNLLLTMRFLTFIFFLQTMVQCVNQPIVRASITLQNPESGLPNTWASIKHIYTNHGLGGLWHGTSAGILKTVPKYCTAVLVKDFMEDRLPQIDDISSPTYDRDRLCRSAAKSATAGLAGAVLTNPLDVIRNEMFKTNESLPKTIRRLINETGSGFATRGMAKNMIAVAIPVGCTIFFTDVLIQFTTTRNNNNNNNTATTSNINNNTTQRRRQDP